MAKKRKKSKRLSVRKQVVEKPALIFSKNTKLQFISYKITDEPLDDTTVPDEIQDEMQSLFEKVQQSPGSIIKRLEELITKYPKVPKLYNFISIAYSRLNDTVKSKHYVEENYLNNPDYLFAKLNYAEIFIIEGNHEKIPEILDNKFDIKALYPERDVFHISEVIGFMGIAGCYFAMAGYKKQAELFYRSLEDLAPGHPYAKRIEQYLLMNSVSSGVNKLKGRR